MTWQEAPGLEFRYPRSLLLSLSTEGWEEASQEGFLQEEACRGVRSEGEGRAQAPSLPPDPHSSETFWAPGCLPKHYASRAHQEPPKQALWRSRQAQGHRD